MEKKLKHLEMIQAVISLMAGNSFLLKGWAVTLLAGIFALAAKDADKSYFLVAYVPILVFWGLDSYYLQQERLYRSLYEEVCGKSEAHIDFSMKAPQPQFNFPRNSYFNCLLSKTELWFYLPLALICTGIVFITA